MKKLSVLFLLLFLTAFTACKGQPVIDPYIIGTAAAAEPDPILDDLMYSYQFEEAGSTLTDDLGVHDMTVYNTPAVVTGANGNARMFENYAGDQNYGEIPFHADFKPDADDGVTLMCDFYPTAQGGSGTSTIFGLYVTTGGNHVYHLGHKSAGAIRGRIYTTTNRDLNTTGTISLNNWHRIMMRWKSGGPIKITIDGNTDETGADWTGAFSSAEYPLRISMNPAQSGAADRMINGRIDNIMAWNRELTDTEKDQMFDGNPTYDELYGAGAPADTTAPTVQSMTVENADPTDVVIVFDESVTGSNLGFTVAGTTSTSFSSISGSGSNTITGVLGTAVANGESPTLAYSSTTGDIADQATTPNDLATFAATAITNNVSNGYDSDANTYFTANSGLTTTEKDVINDFVVGAKSDGFWTKLDAIWPLAGGSAAANKWNLKNPLDTDAAHRLEYLTEGTGAITHDAYGMEIGAVDNDNGAWANTNYFLSDLGSSTDDFEGSIFIYSNRPFPELTRPRGIIALSGSENFHLENLRATTGKSIQYFSDQSQESADNPTQDGVGFAAFSTDGANVKLYADGHEVATEAITARSLDLTSDKPLGIGSLVVGSAPWTGSDALGTYHSSARYGFAGAGSADLTATDHLNLYERVITLMDGLNRMDDHVTGTDLYKDRASGRFSPTSTDIADWSDVGTVSKSSNTNASFIRSGTTSLLVSGTTTGQEGALIYDATTLAGFADGDNARFSGWVYITDAATADTMEMRLYHQTFGSSAIIELDQSKINEWQYFSIEKSRVVQGSTFTMTIKPSDGTMYVDDVAVMKTN